MKRLFKDKALQKTVTYRIAAGLGGALIVWLFTGNITATAGASIAGEAYRSGIYFVHEKWWENKEAITEIITKDNHVSDEEHEAFN